VEDQLAKEKENKAGLDAENLKLKDEVSHLKAKVYEDGFSLNSLRSELQESASKLQETQEKLEEAYQDMDTTVDDSYRDCVKMLQILNPGVDLNTRGLCKFHGVKDGMFLDFHDPHNPVPLDPTDPRLEPFDYSTPPPSEVVPGPGDVDAGGAD
jgi:hydroxymethylpyrimidine pyrophosphatase-like HAD family hydrolase